MLSSYQSNAKLRTQTGCLKCRQRRKKCDEVKPRCTGCSRMGLQCTWPTVVNQEADRRRAPWSWKSQQSLAGALRGLSLEPADRAALFSHFANSIVPRIVREACRPEYSNQEYMLRLARNSPPLMAVMIAIAALDMKTPYHENLAMESYRYSLHNLRLQLANASDARNDDASLATTVFLCVFENLRPDAQVNLNLHATATAALLTQRDTAEMQTSLPSATTFERLCAESFLYHSSLMMLFNPSLDAVAKVDYTLDWARYFPNTQHEARRWLDKTAHPVLDAPYDLFLLIARVTRLARASRPLSQDQVHTWEHLSSQLLQFKQVAGEDAFKLHLEAMHIMLLKVHPTLPESEIVEQVCCILQLALEILYVLDTKSSLLGYLLWPLTVLGSVAVDSHARRSLEKKIDELASRPHGLVTRTQNWLRYIWGLPQGDKAMMIQRRLRILVEGTESNICIVQRQAK